ncbi:fimbrial protein [Xenorhabdus sp. KJ12.1]|nr:fimbrial protein [Xenorhabdus sp. KJ12.1]
MCNPSPPPAPVYHAPLKSISLTVGNDNNSAQLYSYHAQLNMGYTCTGNPPYTYSMKVVNGTLAEGYSDVYTTNIPGIGIKFVRLVSNQDVNGTGSFSVNINALFIRTHTGRLSSGNIIGNQLPKVSGVILDSDGEEYANPLYTLGYSGLIPITVASCATPDNLTYSLKTVHSGDFSGVNSATAWVNTPVTLKSCSDFYGYMSGGFYEWSSTTPNDIGEKGVIKAKNTLLMHLKPNTPIINSELGIIGLDETGMQAAGGIGIQLGIQSNRTYIPVNLSAPIQVNPVLGDTSKTVQFNLGARYIQTEKAITPGLANASVIYTINYQ